MELTNILTEHRSIILPESNGKKRVLEQAAKLIAEDLEDVTFQQVFRGFVEREKIGSTAIGHGVALPHIRTEKLKQPKAAFIRLNSSINFADIGEHPVDLIFALAVPDDNAQAHLDLLAQISEQFSQKDFRKQLRQAENAQQLWMLFTNPHDSCN